MKIHCLLPTKFMSGRQTLQAPGPVITKHRYTIPELYRLRETLRFLFCPLANFSPEAFQYFIVTPHIPASAYIDPQIRQKIFRTLVKIDQERMTSTPVKKVLPPHLRMRASQPAAPVALNPITPLTVVYGNVVGNETAKELEPGTELKSTKPELKTTKSELDNTKRGPETAQPVDKAMAEAWWAKLPGEQKIGIAELYILEVHQLPAVSIHKPVEKSGLNPTVPAFNMGALREVMPNVPAVSAKQGEWGSSSSAAKQDDWNTDSSTKTDDWNVSPIQASSSVAPVRTIASPVEVTMAAPVRAMAAPIKTTAAPVKGNISSTTSTRQDDWTTTSSMQQGDWVTPSTTSQPLISIDSESSTTQINETVVEADKLTPPHKSAWIGLKSNGEEQDEFIRFMTANVFPRLIQSIPKKPILDTTYVTEIPDPAPADDYTSITSNNFSYDW
ncbi:hypothetical protein BGX38DRAFT_884371 [Terfezia claveryi]|nr:hypothetical protein BGX38DRAFT_884371 [Terfezia claveryi]